MSNGKAFPFTDDLGPHLTEEQAQAIYEQGREAVVFALLAFAKMQAEAAAGAMPSTPSGMIPVYQKSNATSRKRRKKPGRPEGHAGARRPTPEEIDHRVEHTVTSCPHCHAPVGNPVDSRTRITEDIPEPVKPEVTEHTIHRYWCGACGKLVEAPVCDALAGCTIGHNASALTAWLHYGLGNTISQILLVLNYYLQFPLSEGGLVQIWHRMAEILFPWYEQIGQEARQSAALHADETGWRVGGVTHWLWCFTTPMVTFYMITRNRGSPALKRFFTEVFEGVLISDFWGAYNKIACAERQLCFAHLFRELATVDERNSSSGWQEFRKKMKRLMRDAVRLSMATGYTEAEWDSRRACLDKRLAELLDEPWEDADARRLVKRLRRHQNQLFTFLDHEDVPSDNNRAEREIRPAVIIRKNSLANASEKGAETQAILMSIYRTLKLRGHDPVKTIVSAMKIYLETGHLPPLPNKLTSNG